MTQKELKEAIEKAKRIKRWKQVQAKHYKLYEQSTKDNPRSELPDNSSY